MWWPWVIFRDSMGPVGQNVNYWWNWVADMTQLDISVTGRSRSFPQLRCSMCLWQELLWSKYSPRFMQSGVGVTFPIVLYFALFQSRLFHIAFCLNLPSTRIIGTHPPPHGLGVAFENKCRNCRFLRTWHWNDNSQAKLNQDSVSVKTRVTVDWVNQKRLTALSLQSFSSTANC